MHQYMHLCPPDCLCLLHSPMHTLMETLVPVCGIVCLSQSPYFLTHTLVRMCTMHQYMNFMFPWLSAPLPMHSLMESWVPLYCSVFMSQSPHFCSPTLVRMCTCISTCIHVHLIYHVCFTFLNSDMETWVPLYGRMCVCCSQLALVPHLD